jgi:hypothetical protein
MPRVRGLLVVTFLVLACASCSGSGHGRSGGPPTSASVSTPSSPTPNVPADLATYSVDERAAYRDAVQAYAAFTKRNSQFLAKGQTTRAASDFYHHYATHWVEAWANLAELANNDVTVSGPTRVVWVHPKRIDLDPSGSAVVVVRRCLDESRLKVTQGGDLVDQPQLKEPHVYQVRLAKKAGEAHWRSGSVKQGAKC